MNNNIPEGWIYEDSLPSMPKHDYESWYKSSRVIDGVRMGPPVPVEKAPEPHYRNFIKPEDLDRMNAFFRPFVLALPLGPIRESEHEKPFYEGALLYTRILTATTGLINLEIVVPFLKCLSENMEGMQAHDLKQFIIEKLPSVMTKVTEALDFHKDNINLTTEHVREFCEINGVEFHQTPYAG